MINQKCKLNKQKRYNIMETQARVMATLNKVKEARAKKQEKLGAIEDAIKEVQENLIAKEKEMTSIVTELGTQIENINSF